MFQHLVCLLAVGLSISLQVAVDPPEKQLTNTFRLLHGLNPVKAVRKFCSANPLSENDCGQLKSYVTEELCKLDDSGMNCNLQSYSDDTIIVDNSTGIRWGSVPIYINLAQVQAGEVTSMLYLPISTTDVDKNVDAFCNIHNLSGQQCRDIRFEVQNYVNNWFKNNARPTVQGAFKIYASCGGLKLHVCAL